MGSNTAPPSKARDRSSCFRACWILDGSRKYAAMLGLECLGQGLPRRGGTRRKMTREGQALISSDYKQQTTTDSTFMSLLHIN
jgi:hypothetical protein